MQPANIGSGQRFAATVGSRAANLAESSAKGLCVVRIDYVSTAAAAELGSCQGAAKVAAEKPQAPSGDPHSPSNFALLLQGRRRQQPLTHPTRIVLPFFLGTVCYREYM